MRTIEGADLDGAGRSADDERIADRYVLDRELSAARGTREYRARDTTLDRWVRVRTVSAEDPRAGEFLDAARRAALISDVHVPRVLDAGTDASGAGGAGGEAVVYAVVEDVDGRSLSRLLRSGPLKPAAVRSLVGEVATALDAAARRGLHHTRLSPDTVVLGPDGVVRVLGIGLEAALEEDPPAVSPVRAATLANRADAVGLVALVYAGLTGRWPEVPGLAAVTDLPLSPATDGEPPPPKDLHPDVPNDLDTLCAVTFGPHGDGPRDPAELALQLAPWSMDAWQDVLREMRGERATAEVRGRLKNRDEVVPEAEPPVPFTRPRSTGRPERADSRLVIGIVAAVLAAGLVLALWQLSRIDNPLPAVTASAPPTSSAPPAPTTPAPAPTPTPTATAVPAGPVPVVAVTALDPRGDGESQDGLDRLTDGDPVTGWSSQRYNSAAFGGLKDGIGLVVDLGADVDVSQVVLTAAGEGGSVDLRTATGPTLDGSSAPLATTAAGGTQTLSPPAPVRTRFLLLWFTQLPTTDGVFRVTVGELGVVGVVVPGPAGPIP